MASSPVKAPASPSKKAAPAAAEKYAAGKKAPASPTKKTTASTSPSRAAPKSAGASKTAATASTSPATTKGKTSEIKKIGGAKNGQIRVIHAAERRNYTAQAPKRPLHRAGHAQRTTTKLRKSITPGTVLILLAGRFRGKRVVFLKQLSSGLLLVTGPFRVNGVPLRRVNQAYVIATSTKLPQEASKQIAGAAAAIDDGFFRREQDYNKKRTVAAFFDDKKNKKEKVALSKMQAQKKVDAVLSPLIKKIPRMSDYLHARFALGNKSLVHNMKF